MFSEETHKEIHHENVQVYQQKPEAWVKRKNK